MWQFIKYVFATIIGIFVFSFLALFLLIGIGAAMSSGDSNVEIKEKTILKIDLNRAIQENRVEDDPFSELFSNDEPTATSLIQIKEALANAKLDANVKGIYLKCESPMAGWATLEEVRDALLDFKKSKKMVYSYAEAMDDKGYYLASVADKIYITPQGGLEFNGLSAEYSFMKGLFDKLEIKPEVFRVGEYKSAVEPFIKTEMSKENKEQTQDFLNGITGHAFAKIALSRNISVDSLDKIANGYLARTPQDAKNLKLITNVGYQDEFEADLRQMAAIKIDDKINFVGLNDYLKAEKQIKSNGADKKIAVLIADGEIISGNSTDGVIASESFIKDLRKVRKDKNVHGIVLRINSPGGSALASDVMWREIQLTKKEKPIIASISDYGTSGGYYLAMGCDAIVAQPTSIMSNIGIFGIVFNVEKLLNNKLGITFDGAKTHEFANFPSGTRTMSDAEKLILQKGVEQGYETFTSKAAAGRKITLEQLKDLARGRVWTGKQSVEKGLADKLGGLDTAVEMVASKLKLKKEDYQVRYYPSPKSKIETFFNKVEDDQEAKALYAYFGTDAARYARLMKGMKGMSGVQARLPYFIEIK